MINLLNTQYIHTLPAATQLQIKSQLISIGLTNDDIQIAMNSRLCDLSDTINLNDIN